MKSRCLAVYEIRDADVGASFEVRAFYASFEVRIFYASFEVRTFDAYFEVRIFDAYFGVRTLVKKKQQKPLIYA